MKKRGYAFFVAMLTAALFELYSVTNVQADTRPAFPSDKGLLHFTLKSTGANYTFEFDLNPGGQEARLEAAQHVLHTAYDDSTIETRQSSFFLKEGAKCFVFDARFHTYTACFLPNDYAPGKESRFWGYVTRVPNGWWLVTHNLLPLLALLGLFGWWLRPKRVKAALPSNAIENPRSFRPVR